MRTLVLLLVLLTSCARPLDPYRDLVVYTSMYQDTLAGLEAELKKDFPQLRLHWYQAGSEEIAARTNAEILAGGVRADLLISSDRFWYEELAAAKVIAALPADVTAKVDPELRNGEDRYVAVSHPLMVLVYNRTLVKQGPQSFLELTRPEWKELITTGSPLASGTNFTTVAMLREKYGWDYFRKLRDQGVVSQGGNSAVIRRLQSGERSAGWVLLEDLLRLRGKDDRLVAVFPSDGATLQTNILALPVKPTDRSLALKVAAWLVSEKGQRLMTRYFMYSVLPEVAAPMGAPPLSTLKLQRPDKAFLERMSRERLEVKDQYLELML